MKSITTSQFWKLYDQLPEEVKIRSDSAYELWQINPNAYGHISSEWERESLFIQFVLVVAIDRLAYFKEMLLFGFGLVLMMNTNEY